MEEGKFILRIYRGFSGAQYWEEFELEKKPGLNIISALMEIQKNPVTKKGKKVEPVAWEMACLEEVCGSCSMIINKIPRQACTALIETLIAENKSHVITLAPFSKFPVIRDLVVDRSSMFQSLKKIKGWIPLEESHSPEFGPKISPLKQEAMYVESTCMTCGCCLEACPQINKSSKFIGPAAINQVKLFNANPAGSVLKSERLQVLMGEGGISECGNSQNCKAVCPKKIPLTQSIAQIGKDATKEFFNLAMGLPENES
jgi:succinate dehydrogenase / fumarate reductase iron-sulfur subunit